MGGAALSWLLHSARQLVLLYPKPTVDGDQDYMDGGGSHHQVKNKAVVACNNAAAGGFEMPLHYPRYTKVEYEKMEEWKVDLLLKQYGLAFNGTLDQKRAYAMGAFLWPHQYH